MEWNWRQLHAGSLMIPHLIGFQCFVFYNVSNAVRWVLHDDITIINFYIYMAWAWEGKKRERYSLVFQCGLLPSGLIELWEENSGLLSTK